MADADMLKENSYSLHEQSPPEGDIVLVGNDNVGARVHKFFLQAHSTVFRSMLAVPCTDDSVILPDTPGDAVVLLANALHGLKPSALPSYKIATTALEACRQYDMPRIGEDILKLYLRIVEGHQYVDCFIWASRFNSVVVARYLLEHRYNRLLDYSIELDPRHAEWPARCTESVRPTWIVAMAKASSDSENYVVKHRGSHEGWVRDGIFTVAFLNNLRAQGVEAP